MKKFFVWSLIAAAGLFSVACDKKGGDDTSVDSKDLVMVPKNVLGGYYKDMLPDGSYCYALALSDVTIDGAANDPQVKGAGEVLMLQLYIPADDPTKPAVIPEGVYKIVNNQQSVIAGTCNGVQSIFATTREDGTILGATYCNSGKVTVAQVGQGYRIDVAAKLANGKNLAATFNGEISLEEYFMSYSTLETDYAVKLSDNSARITYRGDVYGAPNLFDTWAIEILRFSPSTGTPVDGSEGLVIQVIAPANGGYAAGLPTGTYKVGNVFEDFTCLPGATNATMEMFFTWYMGGFVGGQVKAYAPVRDGEVKVEKSGDEYTITIDFVDDNRQTPHKITGTWTGVPTYTDKSQKK